jgi:chorismate synthase
MNFPQPIPPELDEAQRDDARRQAESQGNQAIDAAGGVIDAVASGVVDAAGAVAGAAIDCTVTVATVSLDVVGGILGGLTDL